MSVSSPMEAVHKYAPTPSGAMRVHANLVMYSHLTVVCVMVRHCNALRLSNYFNVFYLLDSDECSTTEGNCTQGCINTYGSYYCTCSSGYRLAYNNRTCNGQPKKKSYVKLLGNECRLVKLRRDGWEVNRNSNKGESVLINMRLIDDKRPEDRLSGDRNCKKGVMFIRKDT